MNNNDIKQFCKMFNVDQNVMNYMEKIHDIHNKFNVNNYYFVKPIYITNHDYLPLAIKYFTDYCHNISNMPEVTFNNITDRLQRHTSQDVWTIENWFREARDFWWTNNHRTVFKKVLSRITPDNDDLIHSIYVKYKRACNNLYDLIFHDVQPIILGRIGEDYVYSKIRKGIDKYNSEYQLSSNLNNSSILKDKNLYFKYSNKSKSNNNQMDIVVVNAGGVFIFEIKTLSCRTITIRDSGQLVEITPYKKFTECNIKNQELYHVNTMKNIISTYIDSKFIHSKMVWVRSKNCKYIASKNYYTEPLSSQNCVNYIINQSKGDVLSPKQISFIIKSIKKNEKLHELDLSNEGQANDTGIKHRHLIECNEPVTAKFYRYVYMLAALSNLKKVNNRFI